MNDEQDQQQAKRISKVVVVAVLVIIALAVAIFAAFEMDVFKEKNNETALDHFDNRTLRMIQSAGELCASLNATIEGDTDPELSGTCIWKPGALGNGSEMATCRIQWIGEDAYLDKGCKGFEAYSIEPRVGAG